MEEWAFYEIYLTHSKTCFPLKISTITIKKNYYESNKNFPKKALFILNKETNDPSIEDYFNSYQKILKQVTRQAKIYDKWIVSLGKHQYCKLIFLNKWSISLEH